MTNGFEPTGFEDLPPPDWLNANGFDDGFDDDVEDDEDDDEDVVISTPARDTDTIPGVLGAAADWAYQVAPQPNKEFAVLSALVAGAAALGRRWKTDLDNFAPFYAVAVAPTGHGKESVGRAAERMLEAADLGNLIGPSRYTSAAGVFSALKDRVCHLSIQDEFGLFLAAARGGGNTHGATAIAATMEAFGRQAGVMRPAGYSAQTLTKQQRKELAEAIHNPAIVLLGLSTKSSLIEAVTGADIDSGFLNRFIFVQPETRLQRMNRQTGAPVPEDVSDWLRDHGTRSNGGPVDFDAFDLPADPCVIPVSKLAWRAFDAFEDDLVRLRATGAGANAVLARTLEIAMRVSLIVARSQGNGEVEGPDAEWAISWVWRHTQRGLRMAQRDVANSPFARTVGQVAALIEAAGKDGVTQRTLRRNCRALAALKPREQDEVWDALSMMRGFTINEHKPLRGPVTKRWFKAKAG